MPRTRYTPRLDDDLVGRLYREGRRQGRPMTLVLDRIVRAALPAEEPSDHEATLLRPALVAESPPEAARPGEAA